MYDRLKGWMRSFAQQAGLLLATFAVLDAAAYLLLPEPYARYFVGYRQPPVIAADALREIQHYYRSHPERGHDLAPGAKGFHTAQSLRYPIWANALGCFDREWPEVPQGYTYFGGDSFTWGFSPYETKYATLYEKETGRPTLKCGVISTGQRFQLAKFEEIAHRVGHMPRHVILNYCVNDVADDHLFPQITTVSGWLVNHVYVDAESRGHRLPPALVEHKVEQKVAEAAGRRSLTRPIRDLAKRYSLTSNLLAALTERGRTGTGTTGTDGSGFFVDGRRLEPDYALIPRYERDGRLDYDHPLAAANKAALARWAEHARQHGYKLSIMLIPPRHFYDSERYYDGVKTHLDRLGIEHLDLAAEFKRLKVHANTAYWVQDAHLTPEGNRIAADALVRRWGR